MLVSHDNTEIVTGGHGARRQEATHKRVLGKLLTERSDDAPDGLHGSHGVGDRLDLRIRREGSLVDHGSAVKQVEDIVCSAVVGIELRCGGVADDAHHTIVNDPLLLVAGTGGENFGVLVADCKGDGGGSEGNTVVQVSVDDLNEKIAGFDGNERLPKGGAEFCESLEREGLAIPAFILALGAALSHTTMGQVVAFHLILTLVAVVAVHEETLYGVQSRHNLRCEVIWCWALLSVKTMEEGKAEEERLEREGEV